MPNLVKMEQSNEHANPILIKYTRVNNLKRMYGFYFYCYVYIIAICLIIFSQAINIFFFNLATGQFCPTAGKTIRPFIMIGSAPSPNISYIRSRDTLNQISSRILGRFFFWLHRLLILGLL